MTTNECMRWLREAVGGIKYPPDRRRVEKELYAHIMTRNRDFLGEGCTEREADEKACAAMGDPVEIRRELAAIHRPFWGYAVLLLRIAAIGLFLWALVAFGKNSARIAAAAFPLVDESRYTVSRWVPQSSGAKCGAYSFRLERAAYARDEETGKNCLLLELRSFTWDPGLGAPWFIVQPKLEDSRGQVCPLRRVSGRELVFTCRQLLMAELEPGAEWAVLTIVGPEGPEWLAVRLEEGRA